jgi:hypothetical protein
VFQTFIDDYGLEYFFRRSQFCSCSKPPGTPKRHRPL